MGATVRDGHLYASLDYLRVAENMDRAEKIEMTRRFWVRLALALE
jgi:hypothetical protein